MLLSDLDLIRSSIDLAVRASSNEEKQTMYVKLINDCLLSIIR